MVEDIHTFTFNLQEEILSLKNKSGSFRVFIVESREVEGLSRDLLIVMVLLLLQSSIAEDAQTLMI